MQHYCIRLLPWVMAAKRRLGHGLIRDGSRPLLDQFLTAHPLVPDDPVITLDVIRRYVARWGHESETTRAPTDSA